MTSQNQKLKIFFLTIIFCGVFGVAGESWAACSGSSPNLTAASASYADVKACTDVSTYGDIVNIPSGTQTWSNTITLTKDIKLIGAGSSSTRVTNGNIIFNPDATTKTRLASGGSGMFEISNIGFTVGSDMITINNVQSPMLHRVRVHNCSFINTGTSMVNAVHFSGDVSGLFDSNTLSNVTPSYSTASDDYTWRNNPMTLGSEDGWYIEDNTETWSSSADGYTCMGGGQGFGYVCRYNSASGLMTGGARYNDSHGCQINITGTQITEIYGNNFTVTGGGGFGYRGGKIETFYNVGSDDSIDLSRDYHDSECFAGYISIPNECSTGNNDDSGQVCIDSVDSGTPCVCQKVNHSYFFNNRVSSSGSLTSPLNSATGTLGVEVNREYFNYNASFDGTSGVGVGTLTNRPATCTAGVGYWATTQSVSNLTGMVGAEPLTPIAGTLYRCTSTNIWTAYYTPYTYPHPLRNESSDTTPPTSPTGLTVN